MAEKSFAIGTISEVFIILRHDVNICCPHNVCYSSFGVLVQLLGHLLDTCSLSLAIPSKTMMMKFVATQFLD